MKDDVNLSEAFFAVDIIVGEIESAPLAEGTRKPSRVLRIKIGDTQFVTSVGQYALVEEHELVGMKVVLCTNLGVVRMGKYKSEALVLGVRHPRSNDDDGQAMPLRAPEEARVGDKVF